MGNLGIISHKIGNKVPLVVKGGKLIGRSLANGKGSVLQAKALSINIGPRKLISRHFKIVFPKPGLFAGDLKATWIIHHPNKTDSNHLVAGGIHLPSQWLPKKKSLYISKPGHNPHTYADIPRRIPCPQ